MHFCEEPFDCLNYYPLVNENGEFSDFAEVESLDDVLREKDKCATKKLHIGAKLSFKDFVKAGIDVLIETTNPKNVKSKLKDVNGDSAKIGSSGYYAKINCTGNDSVICCAGHNSVVKAKAGCWITLAEWEWLNKKKRYIPKFVKTEYVDGEKIKADIWYKLGNGEFVEVSDES